MSTFYLQVEILDMFYLVLVLINLDFIDQLGI